MRMLTLTAASLIAAMPLPALAQDAPADAESATIEMAEKLSDPEVQERLTRSLQMLSEVLLDMPLAPLAEAAAEMAGEDPVMVDPDMTLRQMSPEAENLPQMFNLMAGMGRGLEAMKFALRDMAGQMEEAVEEAIEDTH